MSVASASIVRQSQGFAGSAPAGAEAAHAFALVVGKVRSYASFHFRFWRADNRDDAIAETVGQCWKRFRQLYLCGVDPSRFIRRMARYVAINVSRGRRLCGIGCNGAGVRDPLSQRVQRRKGIVVTTAVALDLFAEAGRTPPPDAAAFRCDFPVWLAALSPRNRQIVDALINQQSPSEIAREMGIADSRVRQLRRELRESWESITN